jgi:Ca-activated chloride channel family protein
LIGVDQETIEQIVHLSIRYGIVTPYTSYLVTEPMPLGSSEQERIAIEQYDQLQAAPAAPAFGEEAVEKASRQGSMAGADAVEGLPSEAAQRVRVIAARTFVYQDGIWKDTTFDPAMMRTRKVAFLSADYFALARTRPDLASAFALGQAVIVVTENTAIEVVPAASLNILPGIPPVNTQDPVLREPTPTSGIQTVPQPGSTNNSGPKSPCWSGLLPLIPLSVILIKRWRRDPS